MMMLEGTSENIVVVMIEFYDSEHLVKRIALFTFSCDRDKEKCYNNYILVQNRYQRHKPLTLFQTRIYM